MATKKHAATPVLPAPPIVLSVDLDDQDRALILPLIETAKAGKAAERQLADIVNLIRRKCGMPEGYRAVLDGRIGKLMFFPPETKQ